MDRRISFDALNTSKSRGVRGWFSMLLMAIGAMLLSRRLRAYQRFKNMSGPERIVSLAILVVIGLIVFQVGHFFFGPAPETSSIVLQLGPDDEISEVSGTLQRFGATYERAYPTVSFEEDEDLAQTYLVYVSKSSVNDLIKELESDVENVDYAEVNFEIKLEPEAETSAMRGNASRLANDPLADRQWAPEVVNANEVHAMLKGITPKRKAIVAIVDTGVDSAHEDLKAVFGESSGNRDGHSHGTHCAGIAGAATNNGIGITSLNWEGRFVTIKGYKALSDSGSGTIEMIAQAVIDAVKGKADVISMSLGGYAPNPPRTMVDAIEYARRNKVIVVAAAGNSNQDAKLHMPVNIDGVIAVSAVDSNRRKASFSNTNTSLKRPIAAPGVDILSSVPGGAYKSYSGTSMACPYTSGLIGILRSLNPDITEDQAYKALYESGTTVPDSESIGRLINAAAAIKTQL